MTIHQSPKAPLYDRLVQLGAPVMAAASSGRLKLDMPLEGTGARKAEHGHLEAFARFLAGAAPALELHTTIPEDARIAAWTVEARTAIDLSTRPGAPSRLNFNQGTQPLVDAALFSQALMRAPQALWHGLTQDVQGHVIECLRSTRDIRPHFNNWLLFSAVIESFFCVIGEPWDRMRVDYALRQHQQWYGLVALSPLGAADIAPVLDGYGSTVVPAGGILA